MRLLLVAFTSADASQIAGFAQAMGMEFDLLNVTGTSPGTTGAAKALTFGLPSMPPADFMASALKPVCQGYTHIAAVSSMQSKDVMARLAGLLEAAMVTDVLGVVSHDTFTRPMVAGSVVATVQTLTTPVVLTFRPSGFGQVEPRPDGPTEHVKPQFAGKTKRVSESAKGGGRPDLGQAKVIVSGGRPLKDADTFERVIGGLADKLGGAVGATRAAVDSGIASNELQVGQTGKIVAPDLYIAAGISGSTQHVAGIKDSKVIVAINNDPEAPIFEVADFGLVADLYQAVPELTEKL